MGLEFTYSDPLGIDEPAVVVSLGSNTVRYGTMSLAQSAELGEPAVSGIEVDDPNAEWDFVGLRAFRVTETSAPSNNRIVYQGVIQDRAVYRADSMLTGASRRWSIDLSDFNWNIGKRLLIDADSDRPAESAGDRLRWLLQDALHVQMYDYGHVTYPTNPMDAANYLGQRASDVLADIALPGGYNFWADVHEATDRTELFFMDPNSSDYQSALRISNDLADVDSAVTFAASLDTRMVRSASRITYGVRAEYANGALYDFKTATALAFTKIDQTMSLANVKSLAKAQTIVTRHLDDNDTESDIISGSIIVPASQVNDLRHGHLCRIKLTHVPGYEDFVWCRVHRRTVTQEEEFGENYYRIAYEASPIGASVAPGLIGIDWIDINFGTLSHEFTWGQATAGHTLVFMATRRNGLTTASVHSNTNDGTAWTEVDVYEGTGSFSDGIGIWTTTALGNETSVVLVAGDGPETRGIVAEVSGGLSATGSVLVHDSGIDDPIVGPAVTPSGACIILGLVAANGDVGVVTHAASAGWTEIGASTTNHHPNAVGMYRTVDDPSGSYTPSASHSGNSANKYYGATVLIE